MSPRTPDRGHGSLAPRRRPAGADAAVRDPRAEARRWIRNADQLMDSLRRTARKDARMRVRLEALRHRRETARVKAVALERAGTRRSADARGELAEALDDLRASWRSVIGALDREGVYL